jgi:hypothetical protein
MAGDKDDNSDDGGEYLCARAICSQESSGFQGWEWGHSLSPIAPPSFLLRMVGIFFFRLALPICSSKRYITRRHFKRLRGPPVVGAPNATNEGIDARGDPNSHHGQVRRRPPGYTGLFGSPTWTFVSGY